MVTYTMTVVPVDLSVSGEKKNVLPEFRHGFFKKTKNVSTKSKTSKNHQHTVITLATHPKRQCAEC